MYLVHILQRIQEDLKIDFLEEFNLIIKSEINK